MALGERLDIRELNQVTPPLAAMVPDVITLIEKNQQKFTALEGGDRSC